MTRTILISLSMLPILLITACKETSNLSFTKSPTSYSDCLANAAAGASERPIEELRNLCSEAANVIEPRYKMTDGDIVPSDEFTRCYDAEKKSLEAVISKEKAIRLAKLSCKYPEVK